MKRSLKQGFLFPTLLSFSLNAFAVNGPNPHPAPGGSGATIGPHQPPSVPNPVTPPVSQPPSTPAVDTSQAEQEGRAEGNPLGQNEGSVRGPDEGFKAGKEDGRRKGFERCQHEEAEKAHDAGFADGHRRGVFEGIRDGDDRGTVSGRQKGEVNGRQDGLNRSASDARANATPPGTAKGYNEAEHPQAGQPDARQIGETDGTALGDQQAQNQAISFDYPNSRKAYFDERYAEQIQFQDVFSQINEPISTIQLSSLKKSSVRNFVELTSSAARANPDFRFFKPNPHFRTQAESEAYNSGYRSGYSNGFESAYTQSFNTKFEEGSRQGAEEGCRDARGKDYPEFRNRGFQEGQNVGYNEVFQQAFHRAEDRAYGPVFSAVSQQVYADTYSGNYDQYFQAARTSAYQSHYSDLYIAFKETARLATYQRVYPGYAQTQQDRGQSDERADFTARPVRLISAGITDTLQNGVFEPGEKLHVKVQLRNFADQSVTGRDVRFVLESLDQGAVISVSSESPVKDLRKKSVTEVQNALEFRMTESSVNQDHRFRLTVYYQGKKVGEQLMNITPRFAVDTELASEPALKEGLPMPIRVKLTNATHKTLERGAVVALILNHSQVELKSSTAVVNPLNPGESQIVEFVAIARTSLDILSIPLAVTVTHPSGRRVGLMDQTRQVPIVNDYRISVSTPLLGLTHPGVTRAVYTIKNISARLLYRGIQLLVRVKGTASPENFTVVGPNPQYLFPLASGTSEDFVVPVLVQVANEGAVLELEVQEDGTPVVVHQVHFSRSGQSILK